MQNDIRRRDVSAGRTHAGRRLHARPLPRLGRRSVDGIIPLPYKVVAPKSTPVVATPKPTKRTRAIAPQLSSSEPRIDDMILAAQGDSTATKTTTKARLFYAMASLVFIVGIGVSIKVLMTNTTAEQQVLAVTTTRASDPASQNDNPVPSEEKPSAHSVKSYAVSPDLPRLIRITRLGVEARVLSVDVDAKNEMKTPRSIYDAGWYMSSSKPGENGAMLINGHVSGPTQPGVFKKIKTLVAGDIITVENGAGKQFSYAVTRVNTVAVDKVDMTELLVSDNTAKPGLSLITCGGKFDPKTNHFEDRIIVHAVAI